MNLRALTKGDAAVAGAAVLLLISSFLPYYDLGCSVDACSVSAWNTALFPVLPSIYLLGIIAAALILLQRFQGEAAKTRQILGLRLDQWGIAFAVAALWTSLWSLGGGGDMGNSGHSWGAFLGLLSLLALTGAAVAGPMVPVLQTPLLTDKPAALPQQQAYPFPGGTNGGQGFQQPGYGYPGAGIGQPGVAQAPGQSFGGQPQAGGYGYPAPGAGQPQDGGFQPQGQAPQFGQQPQAAQPFAAQPQAVQPQAQEAPAPAAVPEPIPAAAPAAEFAPFWFAVPAPRQLTPKDGAPGPVVGELQPGTWYLAVDQRGAALVAQLQDGTQGVLNDVSGIQRG